MTNEEIVEEGRTGMHPGWQKTRIEFLKSYQMVKSWKNKTVLELGAFNGVIGNALYEMGARVTCVEGRQENLKYIELGYPHLKLIHADCDSNRWEFGKFDVIVNFGLLYHLQHYHGVFLRNCIANCNYMFLELVIFDHPEPKIYLRDEVGCSQSLSGKGGTPSTSWVENILMECNTKFTKHNDRKLNWSWHTYDWKDKNAGFNAYARRLWTVDCTSYVK